MSVPDNSLVLVADGEASVLEDVSSTLEKAGFTVLTALGSAAIADVLTQSTPVRLAILDLGMEGVGPDLVQKLRRSFPGLRILFTSNSDESEVGNVRDFLQKPFRRSQLLGRVLQVMDAPLVSAV